MLGRQNETPNKSAHKISKPFKEIPQEEKLLCLGEGKNQQETMPNDTRQWFRENIDKPRNKITKEPACGT